MIVKISLDGRHSGPNLHPTLVKVPKFSKDPVHAAIQQSYSQRKGGMHSISQVLQFLPVQGQFLWMELEWSCIRDLSTFPVLLIRVTILALRNYAYNKVKIRTDQLRPSALSFQSVSPP